MLKKSANTPKVYEVQGQKYVKHFEYKQVYERDVFIIKDYGIDTGVTHKSVQLFEKVKDQFKRFSYAKIGIASDKDLLKEDEDNQYLILVDTDGNELHLSGCTCGYTGTGPHGTVEVLDKAGFQVGRRYIFTAIAFGIHHPETELELYGERL